MDIPEDQVSPTTENDTNDESIFYWESYTTLGDWDGDFTVLTYDEAILEVRGRLIEGFWDINCDLETLLKDRQDLVNCIDVERWAENQVLEMQTNNNGGLASELAQYDGEEHEIVIDGKALFIYCTNM